MNRLEDIAFTTMTVIDVFWREITVITKEDSTEEDQEKCKDARKKDNIDMFKGDPLIDEKVLLTEGKEVLWEGIEVQMKG